MYSCTLCSLGSAMLRKSEKRLRLFVYVNKHLSRLFCGWGAKRAIRRGAEPNKRQRREPLGGTRGHVSPGKLSETGFCAFGRQCEQAAKTQLKNVEITQTIALQHRFSMTQRVLYVCILQF